MLYSVTQRNELKTESNNKNEKMCSHISKFKPGKTEVCGPQSLLNKILRCKHFLFFGFNTCLQNSVPMIHFPLVKLDFCIYTSTFQRKYRAVTGLALQNYFFSLKSHLKSDSSLRSVI